ncbi:MULTISPECIES: MerR family transcriptional regulator [Bradyrhizobium]|uniref:MerR family transcriptional regulator n=3 Tax=Bradyrhizobium TaxID=374 RepID=A0AAE5X8J5_9BRAD|nr:MULTISPECIES: MerR family transcriptional regulator [Bradyrhizobium]MCG2632926.1 MerR family transcriptional regulator [Bradyrhizobium zhengyangense]MCG2645532.1 MerR family transcriptional regulator [Bradyrhizobium zhengyangense]MCG2673129.1 MerR family transcriptional regulator [Bradyrhizobium zhengyangense]MDN4985657.1 MerR family transcriptional regulator [Bradyrhizobium sp. WYCCWR 13022]MDN5006117.1 MerR family transcriptional regulator [Bradyrhizobium sp. WYCCWR 12677]
MNRPSFYKRRWRRIGELADATGVTVRALRHYEQTGLLTASQRTCGGHRMYDADSLTRVYHIVALRRLGLSLQEIRSALEGRSSLSRLLSEQLERAEREVMRATAVRDLLRRLAQNVDADVRLDELPNHLNRPPGKVDM